MRDIGSIITNVLAATRAKMDVAELRKAHQAAADFHHAMYDALGTQDEIESDIRYARATHNPVWAAEHLESAREMEPRFAQELGQAAAALLKMPTGWARVLEVELDAVKSNVVQLKAAE